MADIPGLIKGASDGKGLGSQFLKHIERTKALVYMIDAQSEDLKKDFNTLKSELKNHNKTLLKKPSLILITKKDLIMDDNFKIPQIDKKYPQIIISSISGENINIAIKKMADIL
jgi:GTP-binding protein